MAFGNTAAAPQLQFDSPATLVNNASCPAASTTSITGGNNPGQFMDISQYQCLILDINTQSGSLTGTETIEFDWYSSNTQTILLAVDQYAYASSDNMVGTITVPCKGAYVNVRIHMGGGVTTSAVYLVGSFRDYQALMFPTLQSRVVLSGTQSVVTGAIVTFSPTVRYDGPAMVSVACVGGGASTGALVTVNDLVTGIPMEAVLGGALINGVNHASTRIIYTMPRNSWSVSVQHLSAGTEQVSVEVVASPEST